MLHELLVTMMGHPGEIFQEQLDFKITPGFTFLHIAEKGALEQLAQLGLYFKRIQAFLQETPPGVYRSVFVSSLDDYLNHYRADICDLEVSCMEPHSTISMVQIKLDKVSIHLQSIIFSFLTFWHWWKRCKRTKNYMEFDC
jgi:hypothetical protein